MHTYELIVALVIITSILAWLADRIGVPYPMLMLVGGAVFAVIRWTPTIHLDPELALVLFLPPILFQAAYITSWRDFRADFRQISRLAFGLVFISTGLVAVVAHAIIPGITWEAAFVLGAIVSPPDAVAATSVIGRIGVPHRIVTVLEGESLINDASALIAYRFAIAAVVSGSFSALDASTEFVLVSVGGTAVGAIAAFALYKLNRAIGDPTLEITASLLTPVLVYLVAEQLHVSGVLAVVTAGLMLGRLMPRTQAAMTRLRARTIWDLVIQLINGLVFMLMGIQIGQLRLELNAAGFERILWQAGVVIVTLVAVRFAWVYLELGFYHLSRRKKHHPVDWRGSFIISWTGLRGVVSLATALAIPLTTANGSPLEHRTDIILISSMVIVVSLLGFGLPLPWLMRKLGLSDDDSSDREYQVAKRAAYRAITQRLDSLRVEDPALYTQIEPMTTRMRDLAKNTRKDEGDLDIEVIAEILAPIVRIRLELIGVAREAVALLRDNGTIGDDARRRVERWLDLEELRLNS